MEEAKSYLGKYSHLKIQKTHPRDMVDEIKKEIGFSGIYGYTFWLGRIKATGISPNNLLDLIKEVHRAKDKGKPKGALLNYLLKKHYGKKRTSKS